MDITFLLKHTLQLGIHHTLAGAEPLIVLSYYAIISFRQLYLVYFEIHIVSCSFHCICHTLAAIGPLMMSWHVVGSLKQLL